MSANNCEHCGHKQNPDGGWCYMFRIEPAGVCGHHTIRTEAARQVRMKIVIKAADKYIRKEHT